MRGGVRDECQCDQRKGQKSSVPETCVKKKDRLYGFGGKKEKGDICG